MMKPVPLAVGPRSYRIRRSDKRNLVIEIHASTDTGGWRILSYHSTVRSLAYGLISLIEVDHYPDQDGTLAGEVATLRMAIETGIDRLAKELAGLECDV